ncbi:MAG: hypothetical protein J3Q66DRAFT_347503 [Benniella sp.]|nr:MAG: hypothetical protein J3Q66DRAFT_347503 [Benniella sp.]
MSPSPTHNIVRSLQLAVSISLVATAAFLLHYRTRSHSNFTDEPLASCISGAVAFIYALWAILNHRRQPDNHRWIYLHGLCCLIVCGLLFAGATLAFIYTKQGILCERLHDARDSIPFSGGQDDTSGDGSWNESSVSLGHFMGNMIAKRDLPEYEDGKQYPPGALCENTYEDMDRGCGVMGVVGAFLWLMDFCLIFGFCGSSDRYGPHGYPRRRRPGQVQPGDAEDCYPAGQRSEDNILQEDYYDSLNQRSREPHWLDHQRTKDDPRQHVQGPIPFSMQQTYFGGAMPLTPRPSTTPERPPLALNHNSSNTTRQYDTRPIAINVQPLSPPPLPRTKWEHPPDSPTPPSQTNQEPQQPQNTSIPTVSSPSDPLTPPPVIVTGPLTPPFMTTTGQQAEEPSQQESPIPGEYTMSESQGSRASSPWSPGSACYVYNPSQREYFPSYVNMAARVEQQQQQVKQSQGRNSAGSGTSATPVLRVSAPPSPAPHDQDRTADSQRVL